MAKLEDWFDEWALTLRIRSGRLEQWPDAATESGDVFWKDFRKALSRCGAHEDEADEASSIVCDTPDLYINQYRPLVVEAIRKIQARKLAAPADGPVDTREAAESASRNCGDCGGNGITSRWVEERGGCFGFACRCPMGRWIRSRHGEKSPLRDDPYWLPSRRPSVGEAPAIESPADLRAFVASLAASKDAGRPIAPAPSREPRQRDASPIPGRPVRPELASPLPDPVIDRERTRPATPQTAAAIEIPEDWIDSLF